MPADTAGTIRKEIKLTIRVPSGTQWDFMKEFGWIFRYNSTNQTRSADSYIDDNCYCIVKITIPESNENDFHEFCEKFFKARKIRYEH